jgi:hypothetical protein
MSQSRLRVTPVPRNLGDDLKIMGVPVRELGLLFGIPLFTWVILRLFRLDTLVPFPAVGPVFLSSFVLWIGGPLLALALMGYKKAHLDYNLESVVFHAMFPKYYDAGRDVGWRPYFKGIVPDTYLPVAERREEHPPARRSTAAR